MQFKLIFGVKMALHWISNKATQWKSQSKLAPNTLEIRHIFGNIKTEDGFLSIKFTLIKSKTATILSELAQLVLKMWTNIFNQAIKQEESWMVHRVHHMRRCISMAITIAAIVQLDVTRMEIIKCGINQIQMQNLESL